MGTAGWALPQPLRSRFGPGDSILARYATRFDAVEINSTFYRLPLARTLARWRDETPAHFSVKVPQSITHESALRRAKPALVEFVERARLLAPKLGPLLVQLPKSHHFDARLTTSFLKTLRSLYEGPVVWEPRHVTWFTGRADDLLARHDVARVAADPRCAPEAGLPGGSSQQLYYRLHGSPRLYYSSYEPAFLDQLADSIRTAITLPAPARPREIWCIFDNTALGAATLNALELLERPR